jgi:site-specific DNA-cytosine methylase
VLELFAGGGGLSYIAQRNDKVVITTAYANDINNSAAATYTANHPQAFVSQLADLPESCWPLEFVRKPCWDAAATA